MPRALSSTPTTLLSTLLSITALVLALGLALPAAAAEPPEEPEDPRRNDLFGAAVAVDDEWLVIGAPGDNDTAFNSGAVYLYELRRGRPALREKLHGDDPQRWFGTALALDHGRLLVGATAEHSIDYATPPRPGVAFVYRLDDERWIHEAELVADTADALADSFGQAVALAGDRAAVLAGAVQVGYEWEPGHVDVFERDGEAWPRVTRYPLPARAEWSSLAFLDDRLILARAYAPSLEVLRRVDGGWAPEAAPALSIGYVLAVASDPATSTLAVLGRDGVAALHDEAGSLAVVDQIALTESFSQPALENLSIRSGTITVSRSFLDGPTFGLRVASYAVGGGDTPTRSLDYTRQGAYAAALAGDAGRLYVGLPFLESPARVFHGRVDVLDGDGATWSPAELLGPGDEAAGCRVGGRGDLGGLGGLALFALFGARRRRRGALLHAVPPRAITLACGAPLVAALTLGPARARACETPSPSMVVIDVPAARHPIPTDGVVAFAALFDRIDPAEALAEATVTLERDGVAIPGSIELVDRSPPPRAAWAPESIGIVVFRPLAPLEPAAIYRLRIDRGHVDYFSESIVEVDLMTADGPAPGEAPLPVFTHEVGLGDREILERACCEESASSCGTSFSCWPISALDRPAARLVATLEPTLATQAYPWIVRLDADGSRIELPLGVDGDAWERAKYDESVDLWAGAAVDFALEADGEAICFEAGATSLRDQSEAVHARWCVDPATTPLPAAKVVEIADDPGLWCVGEPVIESLGNGVEADGCSIHGRRGDGLVAPLVLLLLAVRGRRRGRAPVGSRPR